MAQTFTLTRADYISFQKEVIKLVRGRLPRGWAFLVQMTVWLVIGLAVSVFFRLYDTAWEYQRQLALVGCLVVLAAAAFVLAQWMSTRVVQKHFFSDSGPLLSPQMATINEGGLTLDTLGGMGSSRFAWAAFIGRTGDDRNFYLFLEPSYGVILPKSAVTGMDEALILEKLNEL